MKSAAVFFYMLFSLIYLIYTDGSIYWGGFNLITQSAFIGYLSYYLKGLKQLNRIERLFFEYLAWISGINCVYIVTCIIRGKFWAIYHTDIFAYILGISFVTLLIHSALKRE